MKVLLLIDNLDSGGAQNQMVLLAQGLSAMDYKVTVLSYFKGNDFFGPILRQKNIEHKLIEKKDKLGFGFILKLKNFIKKEGFKKCISFMNTPNSYLAVCRSVFGLDIEIIISHRMHTDLKNMNNLRKQLLKWVNTKADHIVCNSNHERKNWLLNQHNIEQKIQTIYNGVDFNRFKAPENFRSIQRRLLIVGSLSQFKNGLLILEAIKQLKEKATETIEFVWMGRVDKHLSDRNEYANQMFTYIKKNQLEDWISFVNPTNLIQDVYKEFDALILASKSEGLPNVVCEALSTGLPVLLSDVLDHSILVRHNSEGFLFNPDDASSLKEAILNFYELSSSSYNQFQENALTKARSLFAMSSYIESYHNLLKS